MWLQVAALVLREVKEDEARDVSPIPTSSWKAEWWKSGEVLKSPQGQQKAVQKGRKCVPDSLGPRCWEDFPKWLNG